MSNPVCQWATCPLPDDAKSSWLNEQYLCKHRVYNRERATYECNNPEHYQAKSMS